MMATPAVPSGENGYDGCFADALTDGRPTSDNMPSGDEESYSCVSRVLCQVRLDADSEEMLMLMKYKASDLFRRVL